MISARRDVWPDEPASACGVLGSGEYRRRLIPREQARLPSLPYIARGSLSETQYFIHLSRRLAYLSLEEADKLHQQTKQVFGCLHGLIQAVEKESGKFAKVTATVTSLIVLGLARFSTGPLL